MPFFSTHITSKQPFNPLPMLWGFSSRRFMTRVCRPPILLIAETHPRLSANRKALYMNLSCLKARGYNCLMKEGGQGNNTLQEALNKAKGKEETMKEIFRLFPNIESLLSQRYLLTAEEFEKACSKELEKVKFPNIFFSHADIINSFLLYSTDIIPFYHALLHHSFSYCNLDENPSPTLTNRYTIGKCLDLDTRDEQYIKKISTSYHQGNGIITILGGSHVLYNPSYGRRRLIGERLKKLGIHYIGLYPFSSEHTPSTAMAKIWEENVFPINGTPDPSMIYSVDIAKPQGMRHFLHAVDSLTSTYLQQQQSNVTFTTRP